jgi:hypothetical protein
MQTCRIPEMLLLRLGLGRGGRMGERGVAKGILLFLIEYSNNVIIFCRIDDDPMFDMPFLGSYPRKGAIGTFSTRDLADSGRHSRLGGKFLYALKFCTLKVSGRGTSTSILSENCLSFFLSLFLPSHILAA